MRRCSNPDCESLWHDPIPYEVDMIKLYSGYFTHRPDETMCHRNLFQLLIEWIQAAYLHTRFGYNSYSVSWVYKIIGLFPYLHPFWKDTIDSSVFHLNKKADGRLLEVGSGNGAALEFMQQLGWQVIGIDFDEEAVNNSIRKGLDVRVGQLCDTSFLTMSNLIRWL